LFEFDVALRKSGIKKERKPNKERSRNKEEVKGGGRKRRGEGRGEEGRRRGEYKSPPLI